MVMVVSGRWLNNALRIIPYLKDIGLPAAGRLIDNPKCKTQKPHKKFQAHEERWLLRSCHVLEHDQHNLGAHACGLPPYLVLMFHRTGRLNRHLSEDSENNMLRRDGLKP